MHHKILTLHHPRYLTYYTSQDFETTPQVFRHTSQDFKHTSQDFKYTTQYYRNIHNKIFE